LIVPEVLQSADPSHEFFNDFDAFSHDASSIASKTVNEELWVELGGIISVSGT